MLGLAAYFANEGMELMGFSQFAPDYKASRLGDLNLGLFYSKACIPFAMAFGLPARQSTYRTPRSDGSL